LLDKLDFKLDANKDQITDLHPDQGAPKTYEAVTEATARVVTPGVIAVVPGQSAGSRILLVVATEHTAALIEYLTSANGMRELEGARATHGNSPFFEAVILSELNLNTPLSTHLAAFHSLPIKK